MHNFYDLNLPHHSNNNIYYRITAIKLVVRFDKSTSDSDTLNYLISRL